MSDTEKFEISIPTDEDGFVLLQCEHCGEYFKCTPSDVEDEKVLNIFCPSCGLISDNYLTEDVINLAMAIVTNYANDKIYDIFKSLERRNSSKSLVKFKAGHKPKHEYENPIYSSIDQLEEKHFVCCNRNAKINPILKMSASYCPFCGVITFENE